MPGSLKTLMTSPVLHDQAKTGKTKYWRVYLLVDTTAKGGPAFFLQKAWWLEGGSILQSTPEQIHGKNAGQANATSDEEQAVKAFARAIKKRRDRGFTEEGETSTIVYTKPMLAHKYTDLDEADRASLSWPVFVQPKLDGFRMLTDGDAAWTRGLKDHVRACVQHLLWDVGDYVVDGELLLPGNKPLQVTASAAKKYNRGTSETLEYHIYDLVEPDMPFSERTALLKKLYDAGVPKNVHLVPTFIAKDEADVMKAHETFIACGYEGTMIRTSDGLYEVGFRSHGLLKLKDFQDAEFVVVGVEEGKGSYRGKAILVLSTASTDVTKQVRFNAVPLGTAAYREQLWKARDWLVGQSWTIRYQTLSKKGVPIFPVAIARREVEE